LSGTRQVFLSYSKQNSVFAELVKLKLEREGMSVWIDNISVSSGTPWRRAIDAGILESDVVVILFDSFSVKSLYVTYEWAFALGSNKSIIPVLVEDCDIHARINVLQYLDFRNKDNMPWDSLISQIKSISSNNQEKGGKELSLSISDFEKIVQAAIGLIAKGDVDVIITILWRP